MKLFECAEMTWSEPWFFLMRIRSATDWLKRLALGVTVAIAAFAFLWIVRGPGIGVLEAVGYSLAGGLVILVLLDYRAIQRDVSLHKDSLVLSGSLGRGWYQSFALSDVAEIHVLRAEKSDCSFPMLHLYHGNKVYAVGIPHKLAVEVIANVLNRLGVRVQLSGWEPSAGDTRVSVVDAVNFSERSPVGKAIFSEVPADSPKLLTPVQIALQVMIAVGPLLAALIATGFVGVDLYRHHSELSWTAIGVRSGGAAIAVIGAFLYLIRIGQFLAASLGISWGTTRLQLRPDSYFNGSEADLYPVEIYSRESMTKVVTMAVDYGFLQADRQNRQLRFEGNKNRWCVSFSALTACCIEESRVGDEANPQEFRYFVVVGCQGDDGEWEAPMISVRTEIGNDDAEARQARARLLFTQLSDAIS